MSITYNAEEVTAMAVEIEKNGRDFYEKAAEKSSNPEHKKFFKELAEWEKQHIEKFRGISEKIKTDTDFQTHGGDDNEVGRYLKASADSHIFMKHRRVEDILKEIKIYKDILKTAMKFEKDSVVLYTAFKDSVPEKFGKEHIEDLIHEELTHVSLIQSKLAQLT